MSYGRPATKEDLEIVNDHFEETGVQYDESDGIRVIESSEEVALYLYEDNVEELVEDLKVRTSFDESMSLLDNLVDDLRAVFQDDSGVYYVLKG